MAHAVRILMLCVILRMSVDVSLKMIKRFVLKTGLKIQVVLDVTLCRLVKSCRRFVREQCVLKVKHFNKSRDVWRQCSSQKYR
jgi:hypothetical protein